jgi:hypothetical protein
LRPGSNIKDLAAVGDSNISPLKDRGDSSNSNSEIIKQQEFNA